MYTVQEQTCVKLHTLLRIDFCKIKYHVNDKKVRNHTFCNDMSPYFRPYTVVPPLPEIRVQRKSVLQPATLPDIYQNRFYFPDLSECKCLKYK